jgi:hypothetical protein
MKPIGTGSRGMQLVCSAGHSVSSSRDCRGIIAASNRGVTASTVVDFFIGEESPGVVEISDDTIHMYHLQSEPVKGGP